MAGFALLAQLPGMHVVFLVAAVAFLRQGEILIVHRVFMTGMAIQTNVLTIQGIIRLLGVIELPGHPLRGPVTIVANLTQPRLVHIVLFVAAGALHLGGLELVGDMTIFAGE